MMGGLELGLALLGSASAVYGVLERRGRARWQAVPVGTLPASAAPPGPYRAAGEVPRYGRRAPGRVRRAAFLSLFFGQLCFPGALIVAFGWFASPGTVLIVPAVLMHAQLFTAGVDLLLLRPRAAYFSAARAARVATLYHALATPVVLLGLLTCRHVAGAPPLSAAVGLAQARHLRAVALTYEDALFLPSGDAAPAAEEPALAGRLPFRHRHG
jgi:hypothetical protein